MTKLDKPLRREVQIGDQLYTLTIAPEGLKLVEKGKRKGLELAWSALVGGAGHGRARRQWGRIALAVYWVVGVGGVVKRALGR